MKKNLNLSFAAAGLLFSFAAIGQDFQKGLPGMYPASIDFKNSPRAFQKNAVILTDETGKSSAGNNAILIRSDKILWAMNIIATSKLISVSLLNMLLM